jgi:hypothetical protein
MAIALLALERYTSMMANDMIGYPSDAGGLGPDIPAHLTIGHVLVTAKA